MNDSYEKMKMILDGLKKMSSQANHHSIVKAVLQILMTQNQNAFIMQWSYENMNEEYFTDLLNQYLDKRLIPNHHNNQYIKGHIDIIMSHWNKIDKKHKIKLFENIFKLPCKLSFFILMKEKKETFFKEQIPYVYLHKMNEIILDFTKSALELDEIKEIENQFKILKMNHFGQNSPYYFSHDKIRQLWQEEIKCEIPVDKKSDKVLDMILYGSDSINVKYTDYKKIIDYFPFLESHSFFEKIIQNDCLTQTSLFHKKIFCIEEQFFVYTFMHDILSYLFNYPVDKKLEKERQKLIQSAMLFLPQSDKKANQLFKENSVNIFKNHEVQSFTLKLYMSVYLSNFDYIQALVKNQFFEQDIKKYCDLNDKFFEQIKLLFYKKETYLATEALEEKEKSDNLFKFMLIYAYQKILKNNDGAIIENDKVIKILQKEFTYLKDNYILNQKEIFLEQMILDFVTDEGNNQIEKKKVKKL